MPPGNVERFGGGDDADGLGETSFGEPGYHSFQLVVLGFWEDFGRTNCSTGQPEEQRRLESYRAVGRIRRGEELRSCAELVDED